MRNRLWAIPALVCLSSAATAGNPGLFFSEPVVTNFQTVATALWEEESTFYVGIHGNRQNTGLSGTLLSFSAGGTRPLSVDFPADRSEFTTGFVVGARRMAHGFVVGAEFRYNSAADPTSTAVTYRSGGSFVLGGPVETNLVQRASIGSDAGIRFVLGREMSGMRLYGALGVSAASVTTSIESDGLRGGVPIGALPSQTRNMVGMHWALGMEVQATERMSVRFEYSQTNFGNFTYNLDNNDTGIASFHRINASTRRMTVGTIFEF